MAGVGLRLWRLSLVAAMVCAVAVAHAQQPTQGGARQPHVRPRPWSPTTTTPCSRRCSRIRRTSTSAFRFAEQAVARGDYEAAIGALERMLYYNSNLPRVKLELGVLYFKLGSYDLAQGYFEDAIKGGDVPPEVKAQVARLSRRDQPAPVAVRVRVVPAVRRALPDQRQCRPRQHAGARLRSGRHLEQPVRPCAGLELVPDRRAEFLLQARPSRRRYRVHAARLLLAARPSSSSTISASSRRSLGRASF